MPNGLLPGMMPEGGDMMGPPGLPGAPPGGTFPSATPNMDPTARLALAALGRLSPMEPSGEVALSRVRQALELAQKLIVTALPHISQWNAKMAKDLHVIGRQLADARINLTKEEEPGPPPEALLSQVQGTGLPNF